MSLLKKISLIILLLICGCSVSASKETKTIEYKPCVRYYPNEDKETWEIICAKAPFITATPIETDIMTALIKTGFICYGYGYAFPSALEKCLLIDF